MPELSREEFEKQAKELGDICDELRPKAGMGKGIVVLVKLAYEQGRKDASGEALRWIPVETDLPKFRVPVIVHGGVAELRIDGWWTFMECPRRRIEWKVTHWQPLPASPTTKPLPQMQANNKRAGTLHAEPHEQTLACHAPPRCKSDSRPSTEEK